MSPTISLEERAKLEAQNAELQTILKAAKKLPLEPAGMKVAAPIEGLVSWVASDKKGLIYLLQRGDQADPVIVVDRMATRSASATGGRRRSARRS